MNNKYYDITIALGGIFQAASLVRSITRGDSIDWDAYDTCIESITRLHTHSTVDVFNDLKSIQLGLEQILCIFKKGYAKPDPEVSRYALSLIHLEHYLKPNSEIEKSLKRKLVQLNYSPLDEHQEIAELADIYTKTLGTLDFKVQIIGKGPHLKNPKVMQDIRALLLAGIRATVLWKQMGGRRWQLFISRKSILKAAKSLLDGPEGALEASEY